MHTFTGFWLQWSQCHYHWIQYHPDAASADKMSSLTIILAGTSDVGLSEQNKLGMPAFLLESPGIIFLLFKEPTLPWWTHFHDGLLTNTWSQLWKLTWQSRAHWLSENLKKTIFQQLNCRLGKMLWFHCSLERKTRWEWYFSQSFIGYYDEKRSELNTWSFCYTDMGLNI